MADARPHFRLIASDIDGTLLNPDSALTPLTLKVLRQLPDLGVAFAFVTGLNPWVVRRWIAELGDWTHAVCLNGIFTLEAGRPVQGRLIDPDVAREAVTLILEHGYIPLVFGEDQVSRYYPRTAEGCAVLEALIAGRPYQPYVRVETVGALFSVHPAVVSVCETPERAAILNPLVQHALGSRAYVAYQPGSPSWGPWSWIEINHPEARKDLGLLALAEKLGVAANEVLYFGDSLNDLPIFESFPYTVAMENARPEVKALAWHTTASNAEDGVARFLSTWFSLPL